MGGRLTTLRRKENLGWYLGCGGYRQISLVYGPLLSALRRIEQDTVRTAFSILSGKPTLFLQEETLVFLVDTVMALEEQRLRLVLNRLSRVGEIRNQHPLKEVRLHVIA